MNAFSLFSRNLNRTVDALQGWFDTLGVIYQICGFGLTQINETADSNNRDFAFPSRGWSSVVRHRISSGRRCWNIAPGPNEWRRFPEPGHKEESVYPSSG
ncbi:hypothetical protein GGD63_003355 [Bradyrhizobium sp. cir1]|uniref:hypothetical protein n=1 Tax=Bradyrhizobium sp. cir1 TaxID=1445730 RepID=UPI001605EF7B|nr:hypothetical protein [Bradyrhizobium sp. cir1]MBB4370560.1 hypothetical protein [Bradyrhizobium sp. cir1]